LGENGAKLVTGWCANIYSDSGNILTGGEKADDADKIKRKKNN
jgi:hypothetical protein